MLFTLNYLLHKFIYDYICSTIYVLVYNYIYRQHGLIFFYFSALLYFYQYSVYIDLNSLDIDWITVYCGSENDTQMVPLTIFCDGIVVVPSISNDKVFINQMALIFLVT